MAEEAAKYGADEAEICEGLLLYLHENNIDIEILETDPDLEEDDDEDIS